MGRGVKRSASGDGNVLYLDCGGGDVGIYIFHDLQNYTIKMHTFLYMNYNLIKLL